MNIYTILYPSYSKPSKPVDMSNCCIGDIVFLNFKDNQCPTMHMEIVVNNEKELRCIWTRKLFTDDGNVYGNVYSCYDYDSKCLKCWVSELSLDIIL